MRLPRPSLRSFLRRAKKPPTSPHFFEEQIHVTDSTVTPERASEPSDADAPPRSDVLDARLLHRLAEEAWRLGRRLDRAAAEVGAEALDGVRDALVRLQDLLDEAGVKAVDHDGERYVDGLR